MNQVECRTWSFLVSVRQDVKQRAVRVDAGHGRFAVPIIDEALGSCNSFEYRRRSRIGPLGWRISVEMAADDENPLTAIRVGDIEKGQSGTVICQRSVTDVIIERAGLGAGRHVESDEPCHLEGTAPG